MKPIVLCDLSKVNADLSVEDAEVFAIVNRDRQPLDGWLLCQRGEELYLSKQRPFRERFARFCMKVIPWLWVALLAAVSLLAMLCLLFVLLPGHAPHAVTAVAWIAVALGLFLRTRS